MQLKEGQDLILADISKKSKVKKTKIGIEGTYFY
jgi:hypothetical protein